MEEVIMVLRKNMNTDLLERMDDDDDRKDCGDPNSGQHEGESQRDWFRRLSGADVDSPFVSLSWEDWQDMQRQTIHCLTEFQHAAEHQHLLSAIGCCDDLMEVVREFQKEAYFMAACHNETKVAPPQSCSQKE
jgi:hypothetical protein